MKRLIIALCLISGMAFGEGSSGGVHESSLANQGKVDMNNSTTNLLGISGVYTGTATDVSDYSAITLLIHSDAASETNGLQVQFSEDATDWHTGEQYTVPAASTKFFTPPVQAKYYRVLYQNDGIAQTEFHIHTMIKKAPIKWSGHNINDPIQGEDDAELVKSVITALSDSGSFINLTATTDGNLKVANVENGLSIAKGDVSGHAVVHKFGFAPDFDTADGEVTIWDAADDGATYEQMTYVWPTSANIDSIISSSTADTNILMELQGLDSSTNMLTITATLNGQTRVALSTNMFRVFRMKNISSVDLSGVVSAYTNNAATSGGIPTDTTAIKALVNDGNNQTEMAVYTIPIDKTAYLRSWYISTAGASRDSHYIMKLWAREPDGVFQLKHRMAIADTGTSAHQHEYIDPQKFIGGTDLYMTIEMTVGAGSQGAVSGGFDLVTVDN